MSSLLLILDEGERRLLDQDAHYLWIDGDALRVSANPPNRSICIGHFVSEFGSWRFRPGPGECPPELRINGRPVEEEDVELPSGRAEVRLAAEPFSQPPPRTTRPRNPDRTSSVPRAPETGDPPRPEQYVIGPPGTGADLVLDDPSVKPGHAVFERDARGAWWITAGNGEIYIDGEAVMSATREPGSRFTVGRKVVTVPTGVTGKRALPVEFREVTVRRGGRRILDRVTFTIPAGDFVAVTCPEPGSVQLLLGLIIGGYRADSGTVRIAGSSRRADPTSRWVPGSDDLHGTLTVAETLHFAAASDQEPVGRERIDEVLSWMGLDDRRSAQVRTLDDAERERLSIGVELVGRPGLLVVLESETSYSVGRDHDLMARLRTIGRDTNCTIVVATSAMSNLELVDTVVVIDRDGRLRHAGPPGRPPAGGRQGSWAELLATLEAPTTVPGGGRTASAPPLPKWELTVEPEGALAGLSIALRQQLLLFARRGPGSLASFAVAPVVVAGVAVLISESVPVLVLVAVLTGLLAGQLDLVTNRATLTRDRRTTGYGTLVAARLGVPGAMCALPALPTAIFAGLAGVPLPPVPGLAHWVSHWLELWLVMVVAVGAGLLGCSYGRSLRPALALLAMLGLTQVALASVLLSLGWAPGLFGLPLLAGIIAPMTVSALEQRGGGAAGAR